ncbi:RNA-binding protein [candidate division KSB1 bacterium]|nr:RNA-binding protein [candidate division KSB1 bacterium]NIR69729.1 RNA-binding protein [candidate division KSB1 bacterium]NIS22917.1 RNA-binding protein [candidate division KSB1 bacterium]NIT69774.1 RNA-binding protein [candidate division KSB1 bacterium]NIU23448.1 RNA-binding protein [candidate division KSB1 bacterium]
MRIEIIELSDKITDLDLRAAFEPFGEVASVSVVRKARGKSKVSAYVDMPNNGEAQTAMHHLKGRNLKGRPVKFAPSQSQKDGGRKRGSRRNPGDKKGGTSAGGRRV